MHGLTDSVHLILQFVSTIVLISLAAERQRPDISCNQYRLHVH